MFGEKLMEIRKSRGIKRKDLAEKLHTSYETIRRWEKDMAEIPIHKLDKVCEILNILPSVLLGEETITIEYPLGYLTSKKKVNITDFMPAGANYILAEVKNEQMKFLQMEIGDLVIIDTDNKEIKSDSIYAVMIEDDLIFCKLKEFRNEVIIILCTWHVPEIQIYHKSEIEIVGKVIRIIKKL